MSAKPRKNKLISSYRRRASRSGAAIVEAALCIPVVIILMMGTLEICSGIFLKESIAICAFEGARVGTRRRSNSQMVIDRVQEVLDDRQVNYDPAAIQITPPTISDLNELDPFTVTVTVNTAGNTLFIFDNLANRQVVAQVTMVREFNE